MINIDENIKEAVDKIFIPNISASAMLTRIKASHKDLVIKRNGKIFKWLIPSAVAASLILCISISTLFKDYDKKSEILEIGFEEKMTDSSLFHWDIAFTSSSKPERIKNIQVYFGHNSDFKNILSNIEYSFDSEQKVTLIIKRNIADDNMNLIFADIIDEQYGDLAKFLIDNTYERTYDIETNKFGFNQFYDDELTEKEFKNMKNGYLNYSISIKPENDEKLSIVGPDSNEAFTSDGTSPNVQFSIDKNGIINFKK